MQGGYEVLGSEATATSGVIPTRGQASGLTATASQFRMHGERRSCVTAQHVNFGVVAGPVSTRIK